MSGTEWSVGDRIMFDDPDWGAQPLRVDDVSETHVYASRPVPRDSRSVCYTIRKDHERLRRVPV